MPDATLMRVVTAAAVARATKRSYVWEYSFGSTDPPGHALRRDTGMCVCSGSHSDSKPRASASRASASGPIA